ncbi:MAG: hypothetical protein HOV81_16335 [Kofleriaceae bacterium]|nr:hypothetical protein [Kofleriaceae bacterium]
MDRDTETAIEDAGLSTLHDTIADVQAALGERERVQSEVPRLTDRANAPSSEPSWLDHLAAGDLRGLVRAALDVPVDGASAGARLLLGQFRRAP